jgi:hypothetical protein
VVVIDSVNQQERLSLEQRDRDRVRAVVVNNSNRSRRGVRRVSTTGGSQSRGERGRLDWLTNVGTETEGEGRSGQGGGRGRTGIGRLCARSCHRVRDVLPPHLCVLWVSC